MAVLGPSIVAADDVRIPEKRPACLASREFTVADFSVPLSKLLSDKKSPALEALKAFNVDTIFRYYDQEDETLPGKTLSGEESDAILAAGLKIGVVFQHHNDDPTKFLDPSSGTKDAERALKLADDNRQPYGSAIYFAVDGPERHLDPLIREYRLNGGRAMPDARKAQLREQKKDYFIESYDNFLNYGRDAFHIDRLDRVTVAMMKPVIARHFSSIRGSFQAYAQEHAGNGYKIGMYCTAAMCLLGDDSKLAEYFWVSPEGRRDPEYRKFLQREGHWHLVQQLPTPCPGWGPTPDQRQLEFDFNQISAKHPDFGQWATKRPGE
ncbi:MAG TPA: glycoside hydrolase domain-containing protein [Xanthobacteraceae bacterium]